MEEPQPVGIAFPPEDGASITASTIHKNFRSGKMAVYFATSGVAVAHKELRGKGAKVNEV